MQCKEFVKNAGTFIVAVSIVVWALAYFPRPAEMAAGFAARKAELHAALAKDPSALQHALDRAEAEQAGAYLRQSYIGRAGRALEPAFAPLGWDWRITMAALAAFPAREVVIATLGTIFNLGAEGEGRDLRDELHRAVKDDGTPLFSLAVALSIMVFFALCAQCAATLIVLRKESGSWRWPAFTFAYMTVLAWLGAFITYQGARWLGWG
jgi:ferrous iron transport protein B